MPDGMTMKKQRKFCLPMTAMFRSHTNERGKVVVHALDFDLVAAGDTEESAMEKLRVSIKVHIEHGIMNNLASLITCPAPDKYWPSDRENLETRMLPPIEIDDDCVISSEGAMSGPGVSACTVPVLIRELLGRPCRCYRQGDVLTDDWIPDRVNIEHDEEGRISDIWFG